MPVVGALPSSPGWKMVLDTRQPLKVINLEETLGVSWGGGVRRDEPGDLGRVCLSDDG